MNTIWVTFSKEGIHKYPAALDDPKLATGDEYENVSLLFQQSLSDYGTTVYGGYSKLSYDTTATNFDDINGFFLGAKVDF